jgi:hypothetical protein
MRKRLAALIAVCGLVAGVSGCSLFDSDATEAFDAFAAALGRRDADGAAQHTDDPTAAAGVIAAMFDGMGKEATVRVGVARQDDDGATSTLSYAWSLAPGRNLSYTTTAHASRTDDGWRIDWSPAVLHRALRAGRNFQYSVDSDLHTPVVDRNGQPLMAWQTVGLVTLERAHPNSSTPSPPRRFTPSSNRHRTAP